MKTNFIFFCLPFLICFSCGQDAKKEFSIHLNDKGEIQKGKNFSVRVKSKRNTPIDSVTYFYAGKKMKTHRGASAGLRLNAPLGKHKLKTTIFSSGNTINIEKSIVLHHNQPPKIFTYEVINSYPHDPNAFTQGLEFYQNTLYESTGKYGESSLRKVNTKTGEIIKQKKLPDNYFAEGLTILKDQLFLLTWRSGDGFVFNPKNLEKTKTFHCNQSKEGWGICNNGQKLFKSDGTAKIWILNPENLKEERYIQPVTHKSLSTKLNELEWVDGKIYANTWQKNGVAIINPKSGAIEGLIDFRGLKKELTNSGRANVLNGIAYDAKSDHLFVTGKYWDKLFEVKIREK